MVETVFSGKFAAFLVKDYNSSSLFLLGLFVIVFKVGVKLIAAACIRRHSKSDHRISENGRVQNRFVLVLRKIAD